MFELPSDWPVTSQAAIVVQKQWAERVERGALNRSPRTVAGVDVGFEDNGRITRAAVAVLDAQTLQLLESAVARQPTRFPYVPGLLSFREIPAVLEALSRLSRAPELILCDGQGLAHPRRFGIACHLGVLTAIPTVGVAKSRLIGTHDIPARARGSQVALLHGGEQIGVVLRTREARQPLYVSIGHRVSLDDAVAWTLHCAPRYRLPETTRQAHRLASG